MKLSRMAFAVNMLINQVLELKKGESVLIITDTKRLSTITETIAYSAVSAGGQVQAFSTLTLYS